MERRDISLSGVPSEQATGLPLWKRVLDLALIVAVSPGLLILGAGVALVVMCGSRGPVLFRQRRVGYKGREFTCYKFRTMQVDAETESHRDHFRQLMEHGSSHDQAGRAKRSPADSAGRRCCAPPGWMNFPSSSTSFAAR